MRSRFQTPAAIESLGEGAEVGPLRELALHRWIDRVLRNHTRERVLDRLLDAVLDGLSIRFGLIGQVTENGALRVVTLREQGATLAHAPAPELCVPSETWAPPLAPIRQGQAIRFRGPVALLGDYDADMSCAAAPLVHQGELMGVLLVGPRQRGLDQDLDLLEAAASRATPVLDATLQREAQLRQVDSMQMQLLQSQRMEAIGHLAGGIAHDFNNLLTAITGYCNLMSMDLEEDSALHEDLQEIRKAADHATSLTRQLLTFSRRQPRAPRWVDINEVIEDLDPMLQRLLLENVELTCDLAPDLGPVHADPTQLERVLMNLVVNARDAMPQGGSIRVTTRNVDITEAGDGPHHGLGPGPWVELTVADDGEGMDPETRLRVFEPFFTTKPEGKGTGLGLATVYGIVKQAGGEIWIDSAPGEGALFRICLPRHAGKGATDRIRESGLLPTPYLGTETVLLVEDDPGVMNLTRRILEHFGYQVLTAPHATEALEVARGHDGPIEVLLTDVVMPGATGPRLAASVAQQRPDTRVLYMSGHTDEELVQHVDPADKVVLLRKPFKPLQLARTLRKLLDE